jgi:hypothetical protein
VKKNHDLVDVDVTVKHETEKAYLVDFGGKADAWVAKSLVEVERKSATRSIMTLPQWLAEEKGMV